MIASSNIYCNNYLSTTDNNIYVGDATSTIYLGGATGDGVGCYAPTHVYPDNSNKIATTAYVSNAISEGGGGYATLAGTNPFTWSNSFSKDISCNSYQGINDANNVNIATTITTGTLTIGNNTATNSTTSIYGSILQLGTTSATIEIGSTSIATGSNATNITVYTQLSKTYETYALSTGNNGTSILLQSTSSNVAYLFTPASVPNSSSNDAGLGITWNNNVSNSSGMSNLISYGQGGTGGFRFTTVNNGTYNNSYTTLPNTFYVKTPIDNLTMTPNAINFNINNQYGDIQNALSITQNDYYTTNNNNNVANVTIDGFLVIKQTVNYIDTSLNSFYLQNANNDEFRIFASKTFSFRNSSNRDLIYGSYYLGNQMLRLDGIAANGSTVLISYNKFTFYNYNGTSELFTINGNTTPDSAISAIPQVFASADLYIINGRAIYCNDYRPNDSNSMNFINTQSYGILLQVGTTNSITNLNKQNILLTASSLNPTLTLADNGNTINLIAVSSSNAIDMRDTSLNTINLIAGNTVNISRSITFDKSFTQKIILYAGTASDQSDSYNIGVDYQGVNGVNSGAIIYSTGAGSDNITKSHNFYCNNYVYANNIGSGSLATPIFKISVGQVTINGICLLTNSLATSDETIANGHYLQQVNDNTLRLFASGIFSFRNSGNRNDNGLGRQMFRIDGSTANANRFSFQNYSGEVDIFIIDEKDGSTSAGLVTSSYPINAPSMTTTSDYRIKQDIHEIAQETTVDQLNPVTYKNTITGKQDMGFIAHEVQEYFPFLVSGEKDGPTNQSINYNGFVALLTKEIQDLKKETQDLKQRMITLEKQLKAQTR